MVLVVLHFLSKVGDLVFHILDALLTDQTVFMGIVGPNEIGHGEKCQRNTTREDSLSAPAAATPLQDHHMRGIGRDVCNHGQYPSYVCKLRSLADRFCIIQRKRFWGG